MKDLETIMAAIEKAISDSHNSMDDKELIALCRIAIKQALLGTEIRKSLFGYCYRVALNTIDDIMIKRELEEMAKEEKIKESDTTNE